jgi:putative FmdB family regulatory protein
MPTYEYECARCGHTFEAFQSFAEKPLSRCPKCKSSVRRVINGGLGIIFKGSGFYTTDNKKSSTLSSGDGSSKEKPSDKPSDKPKESSTEKSSAEKAPTV